MTSPVLDDELSDENNRYGIRILVYSKLSASHMCTLPGLKKKPENEAV